MVPPLEVYTEQLRNLPYVRNTRLKVAPDATHDALLEIRTPKGTYPLVVELKRSYLDRAGTNALVALANRTQYPLILLARYIPRPTGERLAVAGINFVDEVGNLHLNLGQHYHTLLLGKGHGKTQPAHKRLGAATVQVLFAYLAWPEALHWTTRRLAEAAGVSKTAAAEARQHLIAEHVLGAQGPRQYQLLAARQLEERFIHGYGRVLRPRLYLSRFRAKERDPDAFVRRFADFAKRNDILWALTGGAGAFELDRFYRGEETAVFVTRLTAGSQQQLMLLPDPQGPITFLRLFSKELVTPHAPHPVAHPWLVYAELLQNDDPRALEAAKEIREKHLSQ